MACLLLIAIRRLDRSPSVDDCSEVEAQCYVEMIARVVVRPARAAREEQGIMFGQLHDRADAGASLVRSFLRVWLLPGHLAANRNSLVEIVGNRERGLP